MNISSKLLIPIIITIVIIGTALFFLIFQEISVITDSQLEVSRQQFTISVENSINADIDLMYNDTRTISSEALEHASLFSGGEKIIQAYRLADSGNINDPYDPDAQTAREMLREYMAPFLTNFNRLNPDTQFSIHFHLPSARSLLRTWREGYQTTVDGVKVDISDDLSGFRSNVNTIDQGSHTPIEGIEVGRGGFVIRGLAPIFDGSRFMGSVEMFYDYSALIQIVDVYEATEIGVFMDAGLLSIATSLSDRTSYPMISDQYVLTSSTDMDNVLNYADLSLLEAGAKERTIRESGDYMLAASPIYDFAGNTIGVYFLSTDISLENHNFQLIQDKNQENNRNLLVLLGSGITLALVFVIIVVFVRIRSVAKSIRALTDLLVNASMGDLDVDVEKSKGRDEIAVLNNSFDEMVISLRDKSRELTEIAAGDLSRRRPEPPET